MSIELPVTFSYLYRGRLVPSTYHFCLYWIFVDYLLFSYNLWITAVASIQRYILIYHKNFMNARAKHYTPIILVLIFFLIWYVVLIFFYQCEQQFDYTQTWCAGPCYLYQGIIGTIDWIISSLGPVILTAVFNIFLVGRVLHQKFKLQGHRAWRTTRKLTIQLLPITILSLTVYVPIVVFALTRIWFDPYFLLEFTIYYFAYAGYLVPLITPFVLLISLPEIITAMKQLCCSANRVQPMVTQQFTKHRF